ncbi:MAG: hypothetical protein C0614_06035 [Desulfuromonas sp.]|nr:MAG: hypothetical protein C0614_06035 [Desulfuromonas sp.]
MGYDGSMSNDRKRTKLQSSDELSIVRVLLCLMIGISKIYTLMIAMKMSNIIGYLRVDGATSNVKLQSERLKAAGASKIIREVADHRANGRPRLAQLLSTINEKDILIVESLPSIADSTKQLLELVEQIQSGGGGLKILESDLDTSLLPGYVLLKLLQMIDNFERQIKRERQAIGIAKAKREGRYKGRKPTARAKADEVIKLIAQGLTREKVADQLGIGVASVYRILKNETATQDKVEPPSKPVARPTKSLKKTVRNTDSGQLSLF